MNTDKHFLVPAPLNQPNILLDNILSNLDGEMMHILNDRNLPSDVKWVQYNKILQRHNYMRRDREKNIDTDEIISDIIRFG